MATLEMMKVLKTWLSNGKLAGKLTDYIEYALGRRRLEHGCIPRHFASVMPCGAEIHVIQDDFPLRR